MSEIGIVGAGAYVPYWRLKRSTIGDAWGIPAIGGERAVAAADEDAITMAVEAAIVAAGDIPPEAIDGVVFASTTSPYREKQAAATVAKVLDCRSDALTLDLADSLRGATTALRVAADAIRAGSASIVLVCAADARLGEPESSFEQMLGDAGAAVVLASEEAAGQLGFAGLPVVVVDAAGVTEEFVGPWRTEQDRFVRSFEAKLETRYGYASQAAAAAAGVLRNASVEPDQVSRAVIAAPDPRSQQAVASQLGIPAERLQDLYFATVGNSGTAAPLLMLVGTLEDAAADEAVLVVGAGDGADALALSCTGELPRVRDDGRWGLLTPYLEAKAYLPTYEHYARNRRIVERERAPMWSSAVTYWRDLDMELPLYGMTCRECGTVQYPQGRRCMECGASGPHEPAKLARSGRVFTFTLDHLVLGEYWNEPVPRAVIDLDGGGRLFCELTDCDPDEVSVDMPVELTFRCLHEGAKFRNYYWKGRPVRGAKPTAQSGAEEAAAVRGPTRTGVQPDVVPTKG